VHVLLIILLGLAVGLLVGLMGIGGGIIAVPSLVHLAGMDQHLAQGTSLLVLLPPLGLGALWSYWKTGDVDIRGGALCAAGIFAGGYAGGLVAIGMPSEQLRSLFGLFLMLAAYLLWRKSRPKPASGGENA